MGKAKEKPEKTLRNPLNNDMPNYAVYVPSLGERITVSLLVFALGGMVGEVFYGGLFRAADGTGTTFTMISDIVVFILVGLLAAKFLLPMFWNQRQDSRRRKLQKQFLALLDSLSASFASGSNVTMSFQNALKDLKMQYTENDFIVREVNEIVTGFAFNVNAEILLSDFGKRSDNENIINFAEVFETCYRKGGDMQSVIIRTNDSIREKIQISEEIETKLTSNKMQLNVMSLMPIGIVAMLKMSSPSFAESFASALGVVVNTVAIGIFLGAYKFGQKIVNIGE